VATSSTPISIPATSQTINSKRLSALSSLRYRLERLRDERCKRDALFWAQNWTRTENPHYREQGLEFRERFPKKSYFTVLFKYLAENPHIFIPKSREMTTSWSVMAYATHRAQWLKAEVVVQTDSEDKAKQLVGYAECLYRNQEPFLKKLHPLASEASQLSIEWADGGRVFGIPKGEHKIRMYHPTIYIMDEAAFLPEAQQCYDAALPVAKQIIAVSSAGPGWFGDECSQ
jgi:hypothetical protein